MHEPMLLTSAIPGGCLPATQRAKGVSVGQVSYEDLELDVSFPVLVDVTLYGRAANIKHAELKIPEGRRRFRVRKPGLALSKVRPVAAPRRARAVREFPARRAVPNPFVSREPVILTGAAPVGCPWAVPRP